MKAKRVNIIGANKDSKALLWGKNAAWLCHGCGELVRARTSSNSEKLTVRCECGLAYELVADSNSKGTFNKGPAKAVSLVN
jgi:hypothetical protein